MDGKCKILQFKILILRDKNYANVQFKAYHSKDKRQNDI